MNVKMIMIMTVIKIVLISAVKMENITVLVIQDGHWV